MTDYDALLYVSFGGPEGPDDVLPFLERVTAGRDVPRDRLEEVAEHYRRFGGVSPINAQNRAVIAALETLLAEQGPRLPVYFGNRNWHPLLADTLRTMAEDGVRRALCFVTAAYSSYSGCRQYREDLAAARSVAGADITLDKVRVFYDHPGFVEPQVDAVEAALATLPADRRGDADLVFTTHSIPLTMARHSDYEAQTRETCRLIAERVAGSHRWALAFNSRSGPPHVPWLEPDIDDHLAALAADGAGAVVVVPVGFVSDHLEVAYDLDVQASAIAARHGLAFARASTVGTDPRYVAMIRDLVRERLDPDTPRAALGTRAPAHDSCPLDCCLTPRQAVLPTVADATDPSDGR